MTSKRELIQEAKKRAKEIALESGKILPDHSLVISSQTLGPDISQVWQDWVAYLHCIDFGHRKLSLKKVRQRIQDEETHEFVMT